MGTTDKRIDQYIKNSADFARPILEHLRKVIHNAHPGIEESMKWSFPHFGYKGIVCSIAAFKNHCSFGFWKASLMKKNYRLDKITSLKDLPGDSEIVSSVLEAIALNEQDVKIKKEPSAPKSTIEIPEDFRKMLSKNKIAKEKFESFSPSHKREYLEWIVEAKTEETRKKRMGTAIEWMSEGKSRHWKYQK